MLRRLLLIALLALGSLAVTVVALFMLVNLDSLPPEPPERNEATSATPVEATCDKKHSAFIFGYEFCYPTSWVLTEFGEDKETLAIDPNGSVDDEENAFILVSALEEKSADRLADLRTSLTGPTEERVALDGVDGTKITGKRGGVEETTMLVARGRYTYEITFRAGASRNKRYADDFAQLLSTWEWIDITNRAPVRSPSGDLVVELPTYDALIRSPVTLKGKVRSFESGFAWRLKDARGKVLSSGSGTATGGEMGQLNPFSITVKFTPPTPPDPGTLEVFTTSAKDGSEENLVKVPVRFK